LKKIFISIILLAIVGYGLYQANNGFNFERSKKSAQTIASLREKLAETSIKNNAFVANKNMNVYQIADSFNGDYKARQNVLKRSSDVRGVYLTQLIANASSQDLNAQSILSNVKNLLRETELNAVVIDVKSTDNFQLSDSLKDLINKLHQDNIWVIARFVTFRDSSLINKKPELYIKDNNGNLWKDSKGYYWLDPASSQVQKYLIDLSYKIIDFGFDEIQFDYMRFPVNSDNIVYPFYNNKIEKREIIREFCLKLRNNLRDYKKSIIISVDLFGEVALHPLSLNIGQDLADFVDVFDYISFMIYPSHFFSGFSVNKDLKRNLPALYFPYESDNIFSVVSNNPYDVVYRSLLSANDYIPLFYSEKKYQPQCLGKNNFPLFCPQAKIRPWLQDFNLKIDSDRGISYDYQKVKSEIKASKDAGPFGWLLWNPANFYSIH